MNGRVISRPPMATWTWAWLLIAFPPSRRRRPNRHGGCGRSPPRARRTDRRGQGTGPCSRSLPAPHRRSPAPAAFRGREARSCRTARARGTALRPAAVELAVHPVLVVLPGPRRDPAFRLGEQLVPPAIDHGLARAHLATRGALALGVASEPSRAHDRGILDSLAAQLALDNLGRGLLELELRNVEGARHHAVAAAHAVRRVVHDDPGHLVLVQRVQHARRYAAGIDAMHALLLLSLI